MANTLAAHTPFIPGVNAGGTLLQMRDVHKRYSKFGKTIDVLRGVDFAIQAGGAYAIVGASGAGKSTLLHVMGTLDAPDKGEILYRGESLAKLDSEELAHFRNREIGFVFQFHHLLPEFSALENVMMPALVRRMGNDDARVSAQAAIEQVGMSHRANHKPGELSGGEQQRIALARALVLKPPLLMADEVTGNLDEKTGEGIHELLFDLNATTGITLVLVTHNQSLAKRMPYCLRLADGLLVDMNAHT